MLIVLTSLFGILDFNFFQITVLWLGLVRFTYVLIQGLPETNCCRLVTIEATIAKRQTDRKKDREKTQTQNEVNYKTIRQTHMQDEIRKNATEQYNLQKDRKTNTQEEVNKETDRQTNARSK
jgi:hypothetical protein